MARRSRVRGAATVKAVLKKLPDAVRVSLATELHRAGKEMLGRMRGRTPVRTGKLREGLDYKVLDKSLKLQVGLIGTKAGRSKLFYGRIQDLGRKAQVVTVRRFRAGGQRLHFRGQKFGPDVQTYQLRVPYMPGKKFVTGGMPDLRRILQANLKGLWAKALKRVAGGGGE